MAAALELSTIALFVELASFPAWQGAMSVVSSGLFFSLWRSSSNSSNVRRSGISCALRLLDLVALYSLATSNQLSKAIIDG